MMLQDTNFDLIFFKKKSDLQENFIAESDLHMNNQPFIDFLFSYIFMFLIP